MVKPAALLIAPTALTALTAPTPRPAPTPPSIPPSRLHRAAALASLLAAGVCVAQSDVAAVPSPAPLAMRIKPSVADPSVQAFDAPNLVLLPGDAAPDAPLVVFLPGTGGRPENVRSLLGVVASQGLRVIGLAYNDEPAVVQVCPQDPQPGCSAAFRQQRVFGNADAPPVTNPVQESIVHRLVMLLRHLQREQPGAGWDGYLDGDEPRWSRIVVSGLSQGAGMAAYIAKKRAVRGVVLFSSPWDFHGPRRTLAPWLAEASATAPDRWFAEVHRRENTAALIVGAYKLLAIPPAHVRVFDLDLPDGAGGGANPFHGSTVRLPAYAPEWQWLFTHAAGR